MWTEEVWWLPVRRPWILKPLLWPWPIRRRTCRDQGSQWQMAMWCPAQTSISRSTWYFFWLKNMPPAEFGWFEFGCHFPDVGSCRSQTGLLSRGFHRFRFHWWIFWGFKVKVISILSVDVDVMSGNESSWFDIIIQCNTIYYIINDVIVLMWYCNTTHTHIYIYIYDNTYKYYIMNNHDLIL